MIPVFECFVIIFSLFKDEKRMKYAWNIFSCCFLHQFGNMMKSILIYFDALISNVYLFELRVLSFIALTSLYLSFSFHITLPLPFFSQIYFLSLIALNRLILSVTSFQLQLPYSTAAVNSAFFIISLQFMTSKRCM